MDALDGLVLSRLLCERDAVGPARLRKALEPTVRHRWSPAEWREVLADRLERLKSSGDVEATPRGSLRLTPAGRERALEFVGARVSVPARWRAVRAALAAKAAGAPAAASSSEALRCALVARAHGVQLKGKLTEATLRNALAWKALGVSSERRLTPAAVQGTLLGRLLDREDGIDPGRAVPLLAAKAIGARRTGAEELKAAAIRALLDGGLPPAPASPSNVPSVAGSSGAGAPEQELSLFAARILEIARASGPEGRFGSNKVFLSHVWRALQQGGERNRDEFARRIVEANRLGHLRLSRADLVEAMDRNELAASEVAHENATFHFVRI